MKEIFLEYAKRGAMTCDELAQVLRRSNDWVRRNSMGHNCLIPRLPGKPIRFDPIKLIDVFCAQTKVIERPRSLTIERHTTGEKPQGGYRKCL